jgi:hypothetical protein
VSTGSSHQNAGEENKTLEKQEMEKEIKKKGKRKSPIHVTFACVSIELSLGLPEYKEVLLSVPVPLAHDNSTRYISGHKQLLDL